MSAALPSRWLLKRSIAAPALAYIAIAVGWGNRRIEPRSGIRFGAALNEGGDGYDGRLRCASEKVTWPVGDPSSERRGCRTVTLGDEHTRSRDLLSLHVRRR